MMKRSELALLALQIPLDFFLLMLAAGAAYGVRFVPFFVRLKPVLFHLTLPQYLTIAAPLALLWIVIFATTGLYGVDQNKTLWSDLRRIVLGCSAGLSIVALWIMFTQGVFDSRFLAAASFAFAIVFVGAGHIGLRIMQRLLYRRGIGSRRVAIIGEGSMAQTLSRVLSSRQELGYIVVGRYARGDESTLADMATKKLDEAIMANPRANRDETLLLLEWCRAHHVTFRYSADVFDTFATSVSVSPIGGIPIVEIRGTPLDGWGRVVKRSSDMLFASILFVVFSPILATCAAIIFFETGRPILYRNERVGRKGEHFFAWKFRSMYQKDCTGLQFGESGNKALERERQLIATRNSKSGPIYKIADDPRVTPFGRFLRRWSLDELPQFANVLIGSMSMVGPRPHQPREVAAMHGRARDALTILPGITGLAQISGRSDLSFDDEVRLDTFYVEHWSPWVDALIIFKTPFVLCQKRKAL